MMQHALAALSSPRRRALLGLVWDEERTAGDLNAAMPDVTFGAVSQHLAVLRQAGLVEVRKDGRRRLYRARPEALQPLRDWLEELWDRQLGRLKELAEEE